jgi:hypothetical protein
MPKAGSADMQFFGTEEQATAACSSAVLASHVALLTRRLPQSVVVEAMT